MDMYKAAVSILDAFKNVQPDLVTEMLPKTMEQKMLCIPIFVFVADIIIQTYLTRNIETLPLVVLGVMFSTELLKQSPEFTSGLWKVTYVTTWYDLHEKHPIISCALLVCALKGLLTVYAILEPHLHPPARRFDVSWAKQIEPVVFCVLFALLLVVLFAAGPILKSVAFLLYVLFYIIGAITLACEIYQYAEAKGIIAAAQASVAGTKPAKAVVISQRTEINKFWADHMGPKKLTEGKDLAVFTANCNHAVPAVCKHQKLSLFKAKLLAAGYTVDDRRSIGNQVPAP